MVPVKAAVPDRVASNVNVSVERYNLTPLKAAVGSTMRFSGQGLECPVRATC